MLQLTCYDTGRPVYIRPGCIDVVIRLAGSTLTFSDGKTQEFGERTRIDYNGIHSILVTESADEVMRLIDTSEKE